MAAQKDRIVEEAAELGERFPDLPDYEVLDVVGDIVELKLNVSMNLGLLALCAYENGEEHARKSLWYRWEV